MKLDKPAFVAFVTTLSLICATISCAAMGRNLAKFSPTPHSYSRLATDEQTLAADMEKLRSHLRHGASESQIALERTRLRRELEEMRRNVQSLEKQRSDGEQASSTLMSVVAHEIRSPLTAIKAYTEAMLDNLSNPHAPRERFLGIINDECDRLTRLVSDILDLSRLEAGQRPLRLERSSIETLVKERKQ